LNTEQKWLPMLSRTAAAALTGLGLTLLLSWLAAFAMNCELVPEVEARLVALICCALACLAAGAFSPRPEQGRALGGAMTWAMWAIGYLILKAAVGAQIFCAATGATLLTTLAAAIAGSCIFHKKLRNRTKKKKRKQKRNYTL
jgi:peptidoglycan/LPS O-acetylase OafA/YrhL